MKHQIIVIHGGNTAKTYKKYVAFLKGIKLDFEKYKNPKKKWKNGLGKKLGKNFEVISPDMPNAMNAKYFEWKIWFEKFIPYFKKEVVLIGHSLGGIFLAKYLSENKFPKKVRATILISAPYADQSLADFVLPKNLSLLQKQGGAIYLYHSKDDKVVPFSHLKKYHKALPKAQAKIFNNRGHFNQAEFPELVKNIKEIYK